MSKKTIGRPFVPAPVMALVTLIVVWRRNLTQFDFAHLPMLVAHMFRRLNSSTIRASASALRRHHFPTVYVTCPRTLTTSGAIFNKVPRAYSDPDASSPLVNIVEDESVPIRILKVSPNEIHLVNGDVVPSTCVFLHGHPFIWTPPIVDPMIAMPNGKGWEDWTDDVWTIFDITSPKPEILIFGTGNTVLPVPSKIRARLHSMGIQLDVQNTRQACSTFNLLVEEGRNVAAALLPIK